MRTKKYNLIAISITTIFILLLFSLKNTLVNASLNYFLIIGLFMTLLTVIMGFIIIPPEQKNLHVPGYFGYGAAVNPRNKTGLIIYSVLITALLTAIVLL